MLRKLLLIIMFCSFIIYGEEYIVKKIAFIPYGDKDSEIGFKPSAPEINEDGDTIHVEPGEALSSWDIGIDGKIYLADAVKKVIKVYSPDGKYLRTIGIEQEDQEKKRKVTSSGKEKTLNSYQPSTFYFENDEVKRYSYPFKSYFKFPADVAVDGNGNVYVVPSISANYLMKFSSGGELIEIVDEFGEYGREDIKEIGFDVFSDDLGNVYINFVKKKNGHFTAKINQKGKTVLLEKFGSLDLKGNTYYLKYAYFNEPRVKLDTCAVIIVERAINAGGLDTLSINFHTKFTSYYGKSFWGVDRVGNLYFGDGYIEKYDQQSNLLARISPIGREYYEGYTFKHGLAGMAAVSKIIEDGSIYSVDLCDQGVLVFKRMIKPGTEGRILKPAITDTTKKK